MKPRDGALLRYEGWRSHACLDAGRIKSLLREKMLTCGNAGEWRSSHRLLEEKDAQAPAQCSQCNRNFPASRQECAVTVPNTLILSVAVLWVAEGLSHARGMCYKRAVLSEELQTCQQYVLKIADDVYWQMHKPKLLGGVWEGCFSCPSPSRMSWLRCYH